LYADGKEGNIVQGSKKGLLLKSYLYVEDTGCNITPKRRSCLKANP
jgi:hypothetical protein